MPYRDSKYLSGSFFLREARESKGGFVSLCLEELPLKPRWALHPANRSCGEGFKQTIPAIYSFIAGSAERCCFLVITPFREGPLVLPCLEDAQREPESVGEFDAQMLVI